MKNNISFIKMVLKELEMVKIKKVKWINISHQ